MNQFMLIFENRIQLLRKFLLLGSVPIYTKFWTVSSMSTFSSISLTHRLFDGFNIIASNGINERNICLFELLTRI